jgi:predicted PurR-regulated permease PerM
LDAGVPNSNGRIEYEHSWDQPVVFLTLDVCYLLIFIVFLLLLRFRKHLTFDRFQISCLTLFCLTFVCKELIQNLIPITVQMIKEIINYINAFPNEFTQETRDSWALINTIGPLNIAASLYFLVIHIFTFRM